MLLTGARVREDANGLAVADLVEISIVGPDRDEVPRRLKAHDLVRLQAEIGQRFGRRDRQRQDDPARAATADEAQSEPRRRPCCDDR